MKKLFVIFLFVSSIASAQSVINPRKVEFTPSADHNTTLSGGQAAVTSYEIRWFASGATAPLSSASLGKPTPVSNKITVDIAQMIIGIPLGIGYTAKVAAIGPAGEGVSTASNPFDVVAPPQAVTNVVLSR